MSRVAVAEQYVNTYAQPHRACLRWWAHPSVMIGGNVLHEADWKHLHDTYGIRSVLNVDHISDVGKGISLLSECPVPDDGSPIPKGLVRHAVSFARMYLGMGGYMCTAIWGCRAARPSRTPSSGGCSTWARRRRCRLCGRAAASSERAMGPGLGRGLTSTRSSPRCGPNLVSPDGRNVTGPMIPPPREVLKIAAPYAMTAVLGVVTCVFIGALWIMKHPVAERTVIPFTKPAQSSKPAEDISPARFTSVQVPHCPGSVTGDEACTEGASCNLVKPSGQKMLLKSYHIAAGEQGPVLVCEWTEDR